MNRNTVGGIVAGGIIIVCFGIAMHQILAPDWPGVYVCGELSAEGDTVDIPDVNGTLTLEVSQVGEETLAQTAGTIAALAVFGSVIGARTRLMSTPKESGWLANIGWAAGFVVFAGVVLLLAMQSKLILHLVTCGVPNEISVAHWLIHTTIFFIIITGGVALDRAVRPQD